MFGRAHAWLVALALLGLTSVASAQRAPADQPASSTPGHKRPQKPVPWHDTTLIWEQRATTETLGVGGDPQSRDPYYESVFYARPRYYFWEDEVSSLSVRGQLAAGVELTNSDVTTREHELQLLDTLISFVPEHAFVKHGDYLTDLTLSLPRVLLPTSKASYFSGSYANVGVRAFLLQAFPLRENEPLLPRGHVGLRIGYGYQFARAVVPDRSTLDQLRMSPDGTVVSSDQLAGAALAEHVGVFHVVAGADLWRDRLAFEVEGGLDPLYKFALPNTPVCNVVETGCVQPTTVPDPQRLVAVTTLDAYFQASWLEGALKSSLGYMNFTGLLAPDGRRRNGLWSPDAKFYLSFEFTPDLLVQERAELARGTQRTNVATAR